MSVCIAMNIESHPQVSPAILELKDLVVGQSACLVSIVWQVVSGVYDLHLIIS